MKIKKVTFTVTGILLGIGLTVGITGAYLWDATGEIRNVVTAGSVKAELLEEHWNQLKGEKIYPGQILKKDPVIKNTGTNEANVFLEVEIPMAEISIVDTYSNQKLPAKNVELFTFLAEESEWTLLFQKQERNVKTYVYGYRKLLKPGETTAPLFERVTMVNYLEGELDPTETYEMPVKAKVIQTQSKEKSLKEIYQDYLEQQEADEEGSL